MKNNSTATCTCTYTFTTPSRLFKALTAQSTYFTVRGQFYFSRLPKYWPPPPIPLSARRVCPPPATKAGGTHSPGGEGDGGSIVWKTREIGLPSYSKICTLWLTATYYPRPSNFTNCHFSKKWPWRRPSGTADLIHRSALQWSWNVKKLLFFCAWDIEHSTGST